MFSFHDILVAIDFSQTSEDAFAVAAELSRTYHSRVHLLTVVPNVNMPYAVEAVGVDYFALQRGMTDAAQEQLSDFSARHPIQPGLLINAVAEGPPASEIVNYAKEHAIDLIVLGAHGHGFVDRLLLGSVADGVPRHAPCAVLLVPHVARRLTSFEVQAAAGIGN